jgi:delta 1-pyrroline-5-carboxylate dehydrogenase
MAEGYVELGIEPSVKYKEFRVRLKEADKELRLGFNAKVRALLAPLGIDISQSALERLPKRGGLAKRVAESKFTTRSRLTSILFQMSNTFEIKDMDEGLIRHPVFGHMDRWAEQKIQPNFWTDPVTAIEPAITVGVESLIQETVRKIEGV